MISGLEARRTLHSIASRIGSTDGRAQDFYLGAHLALNLLANHGEVTSQREYMMLLDKAIGKEMASWQACTK